MVKTRRKMENDTSQDESDNNQEKVRQPIKYFTETACWLVCVAAIQATISPRVDFLFRWTEEGRLASDVILSIYRGATCDIF